MTTNLLTKIDLVTQNLLPKDWLEQIDKVIDDHGAETSLSGYSELSREYNDEHVSHFRVVFGEECKQNLLWLWELYTETLPNLILEQSGIRVFSAKDVRSAININCIYREGSDYEKHVDSNPFTGLLFCCSVYAKTGGELVFEHPRTGVERIAPQAGLFIGFDARDIPHYVSPLKKPFRRTSVPMNYYFSPVDQPRPEGLDERLYGEKIG